LSSVRLITSLSSFLALLFTFLVSFFFYCSGDHRDLHSFPTRRSSDLCPMCNWRRAMKHGIQSQKVVAEVIKQKPTVRWLFLTLTVKNVYDGEELNKSLSDMAQGFRRMMQYKKINKNLVGFMRA